MQRVTNSEVYRIILMVLVDMVVSLAAFNVLCGVNYFLPLLGRRDWNLSECLLSAGVPQELVY